MNDHDKGSLLMTTMILITVLLLLGFSLLSLSTVDFKASGTGAARTQAFYDADGGLTYAKDHIIKNAKTIRTNLDNSHLTPPQYIVPDVPKLSPDAPSSPSILITRLEKKATGYEDWQLQSTATVNGATKTVKFKVTIPPAIVDGGGYANAVLPSAGPTQPLAEYNSATMETTQPITLSSKEPITLEYKGVQGETESIYIKEFTGTGNFVIKAQPNGSYLDIYIERLDLKGTNSLLLEGEGVVRIIIIKSFTVNNKNLFINRNKSMDKLLFYPYKQKYIENGTEYDITFPTENAGNLGANNNPQNYTVYPGKFVAGFDKAGAAGIDWGAWTDK